MNAPFITPRVDLAPIEIDPRPCALCGLTIDRHVMVDDGEGPEFFCAEDEPPERFVAGIMQQWEIADPRDAWRWTGEAPPPPEVRNGPLQSALPRARASHDAPDEVERVGRDGKSYSVRQPYRTPQSTIDAFWFVTRLDDPGYLARWLDQHPADEKHLCKLWKAKNAKA